MLSLLAAAGSPPCTGAEPADPGQNVMVSVDTSLGYNDNPRQLLDGEGRFFASYGASVTGSRTLPSGRILTGSLAASLTQYEEGDFGYEAGTRVSLGLTREPVLVQETVYLDVLLKRDDFFPEDDHIVVGGGGIVEWFPSARWTVHVEPSLNWQHYENPQRIPTDNLAGMQMPLPPGPMQRPPMRPGILFTDEERNDTVGAVELDILRAIGPTVNISILGGISRRWSTMETEQAWEYHGGVGLSWTPLDALLWGVEVKAFEYRFDDAPQGRNRTDDAWQANAVVSYARERANLFVRIDYVDYNSTFESERYEKTVTRCGFGYSF